MVTPPSPNVPEKLLKPYDPASTEDRLYRAWEEAGYFKPENGPNHRGQNFSIVLPPPNVTGQLHLGHALTLAIEDIMVRYHRMRGDRTLWLPGTDHAAIATQSKVEKELVKKENKNRHDLGREEFLRRVHEFAQQSHDTIINQSKKMGASLDWSREAFTLDEPRTRAVRTAFKKMYEAGLIYRGDRIVNWDPKLQTTISDDEIVYKEEKTNFYYLKYGPFIIGTARPETKFGDKYVVMHPDDHRYHKYDHGQKIDLEWINGPITATIIKDESIDMNFGTGVMTITPWHSQADFELAQKHNLSKEQVIDLKGKLLPISGEFAGQHIKKARPAIIEKLKAKGLVEKIEENYVHNIATSERSDEIIEPQILRQWFIDVNKKFPFASDKINGIQRGEMVSLKEAMQAVVKNDQIKILPERFENIYFNWIDNLRDWCISRQIWYGHRIPVWYRGEEIYVGTEEPTGEGWTQDEDTLDTWFSSGLWTFSTLGWPEPTADLAAFHPTNVIETGYDIIFFWVARMILMSGFLLGDIPFHTVYLHGLVRDEQGRKLSKSLGNAIDPLEIIAKYGADALRMALIVGTGPGNDSKIGDNKVKAYKHFANKLWNIARFVTTNAQAQDWTNAPDHPHLEELEKFKLEITNDLENFRFDLAGEKLYHYIWHTVADKIIEEAKQDKKVCAVLPTILLTSLKLLHPFMPAVTEELWSLLPHEETTPLIITPWPLAR